ncbi:SRPBCC domain-containing protein [bacterium]|nr:SRPBCC domain-containing protein [bacterium]
MARTIDHSMLMPIPPAMVYNFISRPEGMIQWFCHRCTEQSFGFTAEWDMPKGLVSINCTVAESKPGEVFAFTWKTNVLDRETTSTFKLSAEGSSCRLAFQETGFGDGEEWDADYAEQSSGWNEVLAKLAGITGATESTARLPSADQQT